MRRRFAFRNERFIYKRPSDFSKKEIFSMFPAESHQRVYENDAFFGDSWDPLDYGADVDFSKPFLEQLYGLWKQVPIFSLSVIYGVNSDYSNNYTGFKNCYLVFNGNYAEDSMYGNGVNYAKNCIDFSHIDKSEFCYEVSFLADCARTFFSTRCTGSYNMWFSKKCSGCHDCFGCVNLKNREYHIFNEPHTKEEYERKLAEFKLNSYGGIEKAKEAAALFWEKFPNKYAETNKNVNSSGSYVYQSKNAKDSYLVLGLEDSRYCQYILTPPARQCYDYTVWGDNAELVYESVASGLGLSHARFCWECWPENKNIEYSLYCANSSNLFGCVGVAKREYCILNRQYTKEAFFEMRSKIIAHMNDMPYKDKNGETYPYGEFFPIEFSPYPYNHTLAQERFPLTEAQAAATHALWKNPEEKNYETTMEWKDLPDSIEETGDDILHHTISCRSWSEHRDRAIEHNCTGAFRITPQELEFYRRFHLPLPRKCYNSRHSERIAQRLPMKLYSRRCQCAGERSENGAYRNLAAHQHHVANEHCPNEFESPYVPGSPHIVYCEGCFQAEIA